MYANDPSSPCSSPVNRTKRIVRRGRWPECAMASAAPSTVAVPAPLSVVPCPRSHESKCPPTTNICSAFSRPRISPTTLAVSTGPFVNVFCTLNRARGVSPRVKPQDPRMRQIHPHRLAPALPANHRNRACRPSRFQEIAELRKELNKLFIRPALRGHQHHFAFEPRHILDLIFHVKHVYGDYAALHSARRGRSRPTHRVHMQFVPHR